MVKTLTVLGARPQFIKAAPVIKLLRKDVLVHTGQHYDACMSDVFFDGLDIKEPNYFLNVGSVSNNEQVLVMMDKICKIIDTENPDYLIVYGDTNSTLAGALASQKKNTRLVHIEAGLRSHNYDMPEEYNRIITDRLSYIKFCPTKSAMQNLRKENLHKGSHLVGDTMLDLLIENKKYYKSERLKHYDVRKKDFYLVTLHRPVNADDRNKLDVIINAFSKLNKDVLFPIHPRTKKNITDMNLSPNIKMIEPVNHIDMMILIASASVVITDSGGVQKEAHILETPCVTLRNETEWVESVDTGCNKLTKIEENEIIYNINSTFKMSQTFNIYGDGDAATKIVDIIDG